MKRKLTAVVLVLALIIGVFKFTETPATSKSNSQNSAKLHVVTTNSILEDLVQQVGKDRIELYSIVQRGVDPHEYEPRPTDIAATTEADVIFHNGLNLETGGSGWFNKLTKTAGKRDQKEVFAASAKVTPEHLTTNAKEVDPHAWLDLQNAILYVENITEVLSKKDPANSAFYRKNSSAYIDKLDKLDQKAQQQFAQIPATKRVLVTSEGAFKYFAKAYQIKPVYIWEINTESQGTPEQMQKVLQEIKSSQVQSLFLETSVSPKSMDKVASETGLPIYSKVFTDSLAKKETTGDTYYTMMEWNINQIAAGLA